MRQRKFITACHDWRGTLLPPVIQLVLYKLALDLINKTEMKIVFCSCRVVFSCNQNRQIQSSCWDEFYRTPISLAFTTRWIYMYINIYIYIFIYIQVPYRPYGISSRCFSIIEVIIFFSRHWSVRCHQKKDWSFPTMQLSLWKLQTLVCGTWKSASSVAQIIFPGELKSVCDTINILLWHRSVLLKLCWQNSRSFMILNCVVCWVSLHMGPEPPGKPNYWWLSSSKTELKSNSVSQIYPANFRCIRVVEWQTWVIDISTGSSDRANSAGGYRTEST